MVSNPTRRRSRRRRGWMGLVRRYGVMGAAARYRRGRSDDNPPRRRRRHRARRRNPLWRSRRSGQFRGRAPGRRLHRIRGGVGWHNPRRRRRSRRRNNPVASNPPRHRRRRRRYSRRRNNPVYGNRRRRHSRGRRSVRLLDNPFAAIMSRVKEVFSTKGLADVLQGLVGFGGALAAERVITTKLIPQLDSPIGRIGATLGSTLVLTALSGYVSKDAVKKVFFGGLLATGWRALSELVPAVGGDKATFPFPLLAGMGEDEAGFRRAIEHEVLKQLRGGGVSGMGQTYYIKPTGIEQYYVKPMGVAAYLTAKEAERTAGPAEMPQTMGAYLTAKEAQRTEGMAMYDEFSGGYSPERF